MKSENLISVYEREKALKDSLNENEFSKMKPHEIRVLGLFCDSMREEDCGFSDFDGYFVNYSIKQIGKEFDLLRFGFDEIINIELKSELKISSPEKKILEQMRINYHYLKFLDKNVTIISFVENKGYYIYDELQDDLVAISLTNVAEIIKNHRVDSTVDPDVVFIPSNYLVSPFNSTTKFLNDEYFLTGQQKNIKEEIIKSFEKNIFQFYCVSANAGTGKTLLIYDIAKTVMRKGAKVAIIHTGKLNIGQINLSSNYNWKILSIDQIDNTTIDDINEEYSLVIVDEAQRIRDNKKQLNIIIENSIKHSLTTIFAYDKKQYLRRDEGRDVFDFINEHYPQIKVEKSVLTTKIRTNKEIASFVTNLMEVGKSKNNLNYESVSVEYFSSVEDVRLYLRYLKRECGWTALTYTTSLVNPDPYDYLSNIIPTNAHQIIGQEFKKVVIVMDNNFHYRDNKLYARVGYYSPRGMLYQLVTRAVDELKIVVLDNIDLYVKLLEIKNIGQ